MLQHVRCTSELGRMVDPWNIFNKRRDGYIEASNFTTKEGGPNNIDRLLCVAK